jgi:MFS family permease
MEEERVLKEKGKKNSIRDGAFYSVMDGMGLRYITPYALSIGVSNQIIGILDFLPALIGNIFRVGLSKVYYKKSRKGMILPFVFLQAFFWLPLLLVGFAYFFLGLKVLPATLLLVICYSIIVIAGAIASPAWTSWMQDLVETKRGEYFGRRSKTTGLVLIISMLSAGLILDRFKGGNVFFGFVILFGLACIGRYFSFSFLKKQYEPKATKDEKSYFSFLTFIKKMSSNNFGRFVIFTSLVSFAVAIASPFFSVYMIKDLHFSYFAFTIVSLSSLLSPILFISFIGKFCDKVGTVRIMKISGYLISLVPILWVFSIFIMKAPSFILVGYLFFVEFFSGFVWAAYNLSTSNFIYDAVTKQKIILCVSYFGFINSLGSFLGGLLGGQLSSLSSVSLFGLSGILLVFFISFALRLVPAILVGPKLKEVRTVELSKKGISLRIKAKIHSFLKSISFYNPESRKILPEF